MRLVPASKWLTLAAAVLAAFAPVWSVAQSDSNDIPLGDVARGLRKNAPTGPVIDDDNLPQVMQQAESRRGFGPGLQFLMTGESRGFQMAVPDATCSLSFSSNARSLLSTQYAQMPLPAEDVAKLQGKATIEGDALTVPVLNQTDWHVSEISVAVTIVNKSGSGLSLDGMPEPIAADPLTAQVRPEKKPDLVRIYRMRAPGAPWVTTVFSAALALDLAPGDEWHWAIVQARGYPPQKYQGVTPQPIAEEKSQPAMPPIPTSLSEPLPTESSRLPVSPQK